MTFRTIVSHITPLIPLALPSCSLVSPSTSATRALERTSHRVVRKTRSRSEIRFRGNHKR
ncbi:hypothetical protein K503DRAFT_776324 [Rhizopogon vinicolor AM-OR11-026]|uniref:Uncharacterized protein n=1 Tax=Rhizopogon vinicolor AM-OR11-026 TaxID=1314800 RepID=A0A1B7MJJ1_9AGAM|nr:hypothetical protein K503DRAFT_776324 [Rhizopogon vinicolor AM-OR11-026]